MLDAGNALFKGGGMADPPNLRRAEFILETMGRLGTEVMPAGGRDLVGGVPLLQGAAAKAKVRVVSANMRGPDGAALFPASATVKVGGLSVGLVGLSPPGPVTTTPGVTCADPVKAALDEARSLRPKTDVVIVLAAVPHADVLALATAAAATDAVDFILESTERRVDPRPQKHGSTWLVAGGDSGKQLGTLELSVSGKGAFVEARPDDAKAPRPARSFRLSFLELSPAIADDLGVKQAVEQVEPPKPH